MEWKHKVSSDCYQEEILSLYNNLWSISSYLLKQVEF